MPDLRGPILAATDLSDRSDAVVQEGYRLAADLGTRLVVCHVLPEALGLRMLLPEHARASAEAFGPSALRAVTARVEAVLGGLPSEVSVAVETGSAHAGILAHATRIAAGIVVVGPGRTAVRVSRSAHGPVLVARPSPTGGSVLGATDFSDPSLPAVHAAAAESGRRGVALRLVHCLDIDFTAAMGVLAAPGMPGAVAMPPLSPDTIRGLEETARQRLAEALARTGRAGECVVMRRAAAAGILEAAASPVTALIVVGSRGRTGIARLALGSVAEDVLTHAACSVLIVPLQSDREETADQAA